MLITRTNRLKGACKDLTRTVARGAALLLLCLAVELVPPALGAFASSAPSTYDQQTQQAQEQQRGPQQPIQSQPHAGLAAPQSVDHNSVNNRQAPLSIPHREAARARDQLLGIIAAPGGSTPAGRPSTSASPDELSSVIDATNTTMKSPASAEADLDLYSGNKRPDAQCGAYTPSLLDIALSCKLAPKGTGLPGVTFSMNNSSGCQVAVRGVGKVVGTQGNVYTTGTPGQPDTLWGRTNGFSDDDTHQPFGQVLPPNTQEYPASCEIDDIEACSATSPSNFPGATYYRPFLDGKCTRLANVGPVALSAPSSGGCVALVAGSSSFSIMRVVLGLGLASTQAEAIEKAKLSIGPDLRPVTGDWCRHAQCYSFQARDGLQYADLEFQRCDIVHGALAVVDGVDPPGDYYEWGIGEGPTEADAQQDAMDKCRKTSDHKNLPCRIERSW